MTYSFFRVTFAVFITWAFLLQAEVEETIKRIQSQKGVQGIIIVNAEGIRQMRNACRRFSLGANDVLHWQHDIDKTKIYLLLNM